MHPRPSVPGALAHFAAELFGSLFVIGATFALIGAVVLVGGGTDGGAGDRLAGLAIGTVAVPVFLLGRFLVTQHAVSPRRPDDEGGGGGPPRDVPPAPPVGPSARERHVAAGRSPLARRARGRRPTVRTG
jgi:hypothetical protein